MVLVDNNGSPASGVVTVSTGFARDPGVAWNPNTNEFGVSYSGESGSTNFSGLAVVPAGNPGAFRRTTFNAFGGGMNAITDLDFVESTGRYLMTWVEFSSGIYAKTATFDGGGNGPVSHDVVSTRIGAADAIAIASNRVTGTSLLTGIDRGNDAILGMEIGGTGTPRQRREHDQCRVSSDTVPSSCGAWRRWQMAEHLQRRPAGAVRRNHELRRFFWRRGRNTTTTITAPATPAATRRGHATATTTANAD